MSATFTSSGFSLPPLVSELDPAYIGFSVNKKWDAATLGTKIIVVVSEVSLFQGENKVGTRSSVLISKVSLFQRSLKRGSIVS